MRACSSQELRASQNREGKLNTFEITEHIPHYV